MIAAASAVARTSDGDSHRDGHNGNDEQSDRFHESPVSCETHAETPGPLPPVIDIEKWGQSLGPLGHNTSDGGTFHVRGPAIRRSGGGYEPAPPLPRSDYSTMRLVPEAMSDAICWKTAVRLFGSGSG